MKCPISGPSVSSKVSFKRGSIPSSSSAIICCPNSASDIWGSLVSAIDMSSVSCEPCLTTSSSTPSEMLGGSVSSGFSFPTWALAASVGSSNVSVFSTSKLFSKTGVPSCFISNDSSSILWLNLQRFVFIIKTITRNLSKVNQCLAHVSTILCLYVSACLLPWAPRARANHMRLMCPY